MMRLRTLLEQPTPVASLVVFRVAFGVLMALDMVHLITSGMVETFYREPSYYFSYPFFEWVHAWGGQGMYWHVALIGCLAAMIALGFFYRLACIGFLLSFSYLFLIDQANYLNHYYLIILLSFLLAIVPANCASSIDCRIGRTPRSTIVPAWGVWLLRFQIGIVYFYAGIAKLNADWFAGRPLDQWFQYISAQVGVPSLGEPGVAVAASLGALVLDLAAPFLLLHGRTRSATFVLLTSFHVANSWLFNISVFPWLMIAATTLFFPVDWPRHAAARFTRLLRRGSSENQNQEEAMPGNATPLPLAWPVAAILAIYMTLQLLVPLRHWLYPGDVAWTEEGHRFSWRMKLRKKTGRTVFIASSPSEGREWRIAPSPPLTKRQASKMAGNPAMIRQFAGYLAATERAAGHTEIEIRVLALASVNNHPPQLIIDPTIDLVAKELDNSPKRWILPRKEGQWPQLELR